MHDSVTGMRISRPVAKKSREDNQRLASKSGDLAEKLIPHLSALLQWDGEAVPAELYIFEHTELIAHEWRSAVKTRLNMSESMKPILEPLVEAPQ